jgi:deazaflavin-dependent oxidoreductase (nitroreductase family)
MGHRLRTTALVVGTGAVAVAALRRLRARARPRAGHPAVEVARPPTALMAIVNPVMRWMLESPRRMGAAGDELLVLHVTGRRTGRTYDVPVGYRPGEDGRLVVVTDATWRLNLRDRPEVEVTLRGARRPARAELVEDADAVAEVYRGLVDPAHPRSSARRLGLRLAEDRVPEHDELAAVAGREHLSTILLDVDEALPAAA